MLYFIRHGESQSQAQGVHAHSDAPLTGLGAKQAEIAAEGILESHIQITHIITSPLLRTRQTAETIAHKIGFPVKSIRMDARLAEYDLGSLIGQPIASVPATERVKVAGAEDPKEFQDRVLAAVKDAALLSGDTLIVSHTGVGRMIEAAQKGLEPSRFYDIASYPNAQLVAISL